MTKNLENSEIYKEKYSRLAISSILNKQQFPTFWTSEKIEALYHTLRGEE